MVLRNAAPCRAALLSLFLIPALWSVSHARSLEEWRSRSMYQILTDRFATHGEPPQECILKKYCGGTFIGILKKLSYIKRLGFDAIWISPVVANTEDGYHGYWTKDLFKINPEFGSSADLKRLVKAAHAKGIWVMVDVVANHMGYVENNDFSQLNPFNRSEYFHDCEGCDEFCNIFNSDNRTVLEHCRLFGLPDLDQSNRFVRTQLLKWVKRLISKYGFDGVRVDAMPLVERGFWRAFTKSAGVFSIGEVLDGRVEILDLYYGNASDSLFDFPTYFTLRDVFIDKRAMTLIPYRRGQQKDFFSDVRTLGFFVDSHDAPRFLHRQKDEALYRSALAYVLLGEGIPIVYYGSEQGFSGGEDPQNREPLWTSGYGTQTKIFRFIRSINRYRKRSRIWENRHKEVYADDTCYVFRRGTTLVALTNTGLMETNFNCSFTLGRCEEFGCKEQIYPVSKGRECAANMNGSDVTVTFTSGEPVVIELEEMIE